MAPKSNRFQRQEDPSGSGRVQTVEREIRSEDPSLTPEANELLTQEVRDVLGTDRVEIPADQADQSTERHADHSSFMAALAANRGLLMITACMALVVGGIVALASGKPWLLLVPVALHAIGTFIVASGTLQMSTQTEHVSPTVAAKLEEEGVADPDRALTDLVEHYAGAEKEHGAVETVTKGDNEQTADSRTDPGRSSVEQQTAWTPSAEATTPAGSGSAVSFIPWWFVGGATLLSIAAVVALGLEAWIVPALLIPCALGFVLLQKRLDGKDEESDPAKSSTQRPQNDQSGAFARGVPVVAGIVAMVLIAVALLLISSSGI